MRNYFCGWYYRCQSDAQTLAIIPSIHKSKGDGCCNIQIITDSGAFHVPFPYSDLYKNGRRMHIGQNQFGEDGISLDIQDSGLQASGSFRFGPFTPIGYDIMGPFRYLPRLQCRHSVFSMMHSVNGALSVNGVRFSFTSAKGYLEGDRGRSFPKEYAWTQCFFPEGSLMLSVADVPIGGFHVTGIIGIVLLKGKEYRLATYLGAKAVKIRNGEVVIRQGKWIFTAKRLDNPGHPLQAPIGGAMRRTIYEHPSCRAYYRFEENGITLLELEAGNAAFEYEY